MDERSVADTKVDSKQLTEIYTKLGNLEQHIVNLIHPIQCLNRLAGGPERTLENFIRLFKDPIKIDDKDIVKSMKEFTASMDIYSEKMNLKALISSFMDIASIKYVVDSIEEKVNKRLANMESALYQIQEKGLEIKFLVNEKKPDSGENLVSSKKKRK